MYTKGSRPPPDGYTCNICKKKGHWIQNCPEGAAARAARAMGVPYVSGSGDATAAGGGGSGGGPGGGMMVGRVMCLLTVFL